jgi:hypothetical protein
VRGVVEAVEAVVGVWEGFDLEGNADLAAIAELVKPCSDASVAGLAYVVMVSSWYPSCCSPSGDYGFGLLLVGSMIRHATLPVVFGSIVQALVNANIGSGNRITWRG